MLTIPSSKKFTSWVYLVSAAVNILIFVFLFLQISKTNQLNDYWVSSVKQGVEKSTNLATIERNIGYVGFIHHFKNYVLRGEQKYYDRAIESYQQSKHTIKQLYKFSEDERDREQIKIIDETIDEYLSKLHAAKNKKTSIPIHEFDRLVKVNDDNAESALI